MDLSLTWVIVIVFSLIIVVMATGAWVGLAIGAVGIFAMTFLLKSPGLMSDIIYNSLSSYILAAIPMFIFMGEVVLLGGLSKRLYSGVSEWTAIIPGGLVHSNIVSCAFFAAISGSSVATAATVSTVAYPEEEKRGYEKKLVTGSLAAGGTLGPMIPPSTSLIIYGAFVGESVGKLFIATIIPGVMMAVMFMIYIYIRFMLDPSLGPKRQPITRSYFLNAIHAWKDIWPVALIALVIMVGIYGGFMTPTEAAAVSSFIAICLCFVFRHMSFKLLRSAALKALGIASMAFLIIVSAKILSSALSMLMIPRQLCMMVEASGLHPLVVWGLVSLVYLFLGCFIDGLSIMLLTLPVTYPLMMNLGFDGIWFGIVMHLTLEWGMITPPMGVNLFVLQGMTGVSFGDVLKGATPFCLIMIGLLWVLTFFPQLSLWLPSTMG